MNPGEYTEALRLLHALEGLEMYVDSLKHHSKKKVVGKRTDMIHCIKEVERIQRHTVGVLHDLLDGSEQIETSRQDRHQLMLKHATAKGKAEAFDDLDVIMEQYRGAVEFPSLSLSESGGTGTKPSRSKHKR